MPTEIPSTPAAATAATAPAKRWRSLPTWPPSAAGTSPPPAAAAPSGAFTAAIPRRCSGAS
ncbi:hypothetical protein [Sporomusa ovata]|uniref:hypothetical protein n=1 Tax=Sporomusa ovata TaxID=2378 RepID=UPI0030D3ABD6